MYNRKQDGKIYTFPMHWGNTGLTMLIFSKGKAVNDFFFKDSMA